MADNWMTKQKRVHNMDGKLNQAKEQNWPCGLDSVLSSRQSVPFALASPT